MGSNGVVVQLPNGQCTGSFGTLGALIADGSGNQYILGAAHVFGLGPNGYFTSGSGQPITQPTVTQIDATCPPAASSITGIQVASLSTIIQPNFSKGAMTPADAAMAQVLPGHVSSSILNIPKFSSTPLTVVKKGLQVEEQGGCTALKPGHVITKMLMPKSYKICTTAQLKNVDGKLECAHYGTITVPGNFEIAPAGFANFGDSGAMVMSMSPTCPQPVDLLVGDTSGGADTVATSIPIVLQKLQTAGNYSSALSIVAGGGGCTPAMSQIQVPGGTSADFTLADATDADPDVAQALTVLPDFTSYIDILILDGIVDGVGIDLSGSTAALDVVWDSQTDKDDATIPPIPSTYEGVPVEQHVIETVDLTTAVWGS
ncbi:MAG TPA: hypothetical protein VMV13_10295 [Candidatus Binataceae bacterium]|nr:hypothetical protein [Candidatus Binataceae bacterium]